MCAKRMRSAASGRRSMSASGHRRSAMGEYVPSSGEQTLSSLSTPTPAALDYRPNTAATLPRSPMYSLRSRPNQLKSACLPSPADYTTSQDAVWKHKSFTIKKKDVTWPYNTRKNAHLTCGPGAGHYHRRYGDTGSGVKRAISAKHREGIHAGYPNPLVLPVDTHGFSTPGPNYRPNSPYWNKGPQHAIGLKLKGKSAETPGEGPAAYLPVPEALPTAFIGEKLYVETDHCYPAPNEYNIPGCIGTGPAKSFALKTEGSRDLETPAPNAYYLCKRPSTAHSMTYRPFPVPFEQRPGPSDHTPLLSSILPHPPGYSCREQCLPVFPDILLYPEHTAINSLGPGDYDYDREFIDNSSPAYHIGLPLPLKPNTNPSPNQYRVNHSGRSDLPRPPTHVIGQKLTPRSQLPSPSPAEYSPRVVGGTPGYSVTPRRKQLEASPTPAPNHYTVCRGQTNRGRFTGPGASMRSRPTPLLYNGFPTSAMPRLSSLST